MSSDEEETEAEKRVRLKEQELDGSRAQAEELFGDLGISKKRSGKAVTITDASNPGQTIDLSALSIFNPNTKDQFTQTPRDSSSAHRRKLQKRPVQPFLARVRQADFKRPTE